ncbi:tyrosine/DOPA decarboxylase [Spatholobus suberectus]|nr:tyrosine/DOPA decarboxylase [Spatholobus suberectus]
MAATGTLSDEQVHKVPIKVLVDKTKNKVLFAEARKDFVDVLLTFLTLPLGTIARLVAKESNIQPVKVGSLSSLYESVSHLEEEHLWTQTCKEMLLQPRSSMESYCQKLKLNIDDTGPTNYFLCENLECSKKQSGSFLSLFRNQRCSCGKLMNRVMSPENLTLENGFVKETATFIICDDLSVLPNVLGTSVDLLRKLGVKDMKAIEDQTVDISRREVVDLLKLSLLSKTPLTDFIFEKKLCVDKFNPINQSWFEIGEESSDEGRRLDVRVLVRKSNKKILLADAEEDFADLLFSFLTLPLGGVLHMLDGCSSLSCIDKLYKSISELSPERYLMSQGLKDELANPKCSPQFSFDKQILPIGEACLPVYYCKTYHTYTNPEYRLALTTSPQSSYYRYYDEDGRLKILDPKSPIGDSRSGGGFAKGPSMYMVTDDLVVTPMSSCSGVSYLKRSEVPLSDLEERVISIGVKEGLGILKASLTSTSALTDGIKQLTKSIKLET